MDKKWYHLSRRFEKVKEPIEKEEKEFLSGRKISFGGGESLKKALDFAAEELPFFGGLLGPF